jgi:hypothetical protein
MTEQDYISAAEAATILRVSPGWVAALCRSGLLEATGGGKGSAWSIQRSSVQELADDRAKRITEDELHAVATEIQGDEEAQEHARRKANESFVRRAIGIAMKYGRLIAVEVAKELIRRGIGWLTGL